MCCSTIPVKIHLSLIKFLMSSVFANKPSSSSLPLFVNYPGTGLFAKEMLYESCTCIFIPEAFCFLSCQKLLFHSFSSHVREIYSPFPATAMTFAEVLGQRAAVGGTISHGPLIPLNNSISCSTEPRNQYV